MGVKNAHLFSTLLNAAKKDYPDLVFKIGQKFAFRPPHTIIINPKEASSELLLLHELGHATLGHKDYHTNIDRLKMEKDAWEKAKVLADKYNVTYDDELAQSELDTYRNWLHQKSICPNCGLTRYQTPDQKYHCPRCEMFQKTTK